MNSEEVWKTAKGELQVELSPGTFNSFINTARLESLSDEQERLIALVAVTSPFHQRMLQERYFGVIKDALDRATQRACDIRFIISASADKRQAFPATLGPLFDDEKSGQELYHRAVQVARLRSDFTFETFAVSSTNEMGYAAAQAVSRNPGESYHLLFLYGGVGVGKTHLMQAIGHRMLEKNPDTRVLYKTGEEFTNEIIEAIRDKTTMEFRKRYRTVSALLIDDIQFIGGKDKVQEEFFHTFNAIHQEGGQIVLTSDQMPHEIEGLEARLRSRFEGGLTIDIQQPTFELRTAILLIKSKAWGMELPMDVAQLVAANIDSTRELEGILKRLIAETTFRNESITMSIAEQVLGSMKQKPGDGGLRPAVAGPDPATVLAAVSSIFSMKLSLLKGKRRKKEVVLPRHLAMYVLRMDANLPLEQIGELFGGRDHSTVLHAVEKITAELPNDERLRGALTETRKRVRPTSPL